MHDVVATACRIAARIRRRTDLVGIFPDRDGLIRLIGAVLAEQHEEWACARRYMSVESLAKARLAAIPGGDPLTDDKEVKTQLAASH